jgi:hypothetical protein
MSLFSLGQVTSVLQQAMREISSLPETLPNISGSGWIIAIGFLFLLPFVSMFIRPILRLGATFTYCVSAVGSSLLTLASSLLIVILQWLTVLAEAVRPSSALVPIIRLVIPLGLIAVAVGSNLIPVLHSLTAAGIIALALALRPLGMIDRGVLQRQLGYLKQNLRKRSVAIVATVVVCSIFLAVGFLYLSQPSLHSCLVDGQLQQQCLVKLEAEQF